MNFEVRDHLTRGINRARIKLELRRARVPLIVCAIGAALGVAGWSYTLSHVGKSGGEMQSGPTYQVRFAVDDVTAVKPEYAEVKFKGLAAGAIEKVELVDGTPVLTAKIYKTFGPIHRDARAALRPTSAVQDMYLDILDRGTRAAGPATEGGPLPAAQTETPVNVADALQLFEPHVRARLAGLLDDLGHGLDDRGDELRRTFVELTPLLDVAGRLTEQLATRRFKTRRLVSEVSTLTGELSRRDRQLRTLATEGGRTLRSLGDGSGDLEATLRELSPTLAGIDSSFAATRDVLPAVDRAITDLGPVAAQLPGALPAVRRLARRADPALRALDRPVRELVPLTDSLRPAARDLRLATQRLLPQLPALDRVTAKASQCELAIYGFFHWTASILKLSDARGPKIRADFAFAPDDVSGVENPNMIRPQTCAGGATKGGAP